jgi:hypothetical protein
MLRFQSKVGAFAAAKKTPPWPKPDSGARSVTVSDVANMGQSMYYAFVHLCISNLAKLCLLFDVLS